MKKPKIKFNKLIISIILIAVFVVGFFVFFSDKKQAEASWWNPSWKYRRIIKLTNANSSDLVDFQTMLEINTAEIISNSKMNSDCSDLRFALGDGTALNYVIEENNPGCNATNTKIWIKVPRIYKGTEKTDIYMYYGNTSATDTQDGTAVFEFYDNFETFSTSTWENTGSISTSTGEVTVETGAVRTKTTVAAMPGLVVEGRVRWETFMDPEYSGLNIADTLPTSSSNTNADKVIYLTASLNRNPIVFYASDGVSAGYDIVPSVIQFQAATSTNYIIGYSLSSSELKCYKNRSQLNNYSGTWSDDFYLYFGDYIGDGSINIKDITIDWVQIRKFAEIMPTHTEANVEEERPGGPVGYWDFNEGYGTTAHDNSGMGNDGTLSATGLSWQEEESCISGKCLLSDNSSEGISLGNDFTADITDQISISAWVKVNEDHSSRIAGKHQAGDYGWMLSRDLYDDSVEWRFSTDGSNWLGGYGAANTFPINTWVFVTATYDGAYMRVYVDGMEDVDGDFPKAQTGNINVSNAPALIGRDNLSGNSLHGYIDEVKIYPYARSAEEIKADYNAGLAGISSKTGSSVSFGGESKKWLTDGLVGYWKMDESATTTGAIDSSGNGNDGVYYNSASTTAGKFGKGGVFDGVDDYVELPAIAMGGKTGTMSAWVKTGTTTKTQRALGRYWQQQSIGIQNNDFIAYWNNRDVYSTSDPVTINTWYHLLATYDGNLLEGNIKLYVDGVLIDTKDEHRDHLNEDEPWRIGSHGDDGYYWDGEVDEVRIYNRALSPREVRMLYEWAPGPLAHFKLDEGNGVNTYSRTGNDIYGVLTNGPTWGLGKYNHGLEFDGVDDYIDLRGDDQLEIDSDITIGAWIKTENTDKTEMAAIFDGQAIIERNYQLYLNNGILMFRHGDGVTDYSYSADNSASNLADNSWHHVSFSSYENNYNFYIDAINIATGTLSAPIQSHDNAGMRISGNPKYDYTIWDGQIDDVRIYNYARTQKQIIEDMNAGKPAIGYPVLHLKFDEGYGETAHDESIYGHDGTLDYDPGSASGTPEWKTNGKIGKALEFSNPMGERGNYVYLDNINIPSQEGESVTVSAWVKASSTQTVSQSLIIRNGLGDENYGLFVDSDKKIQVEIHDGVSYSHCRTSDSHLEFEKWEHILAIFTQGDSVKFYKDGEFIEEVSCPYVSVQASTNLWIGGHSGAYQGFNGSIDEVKIWNFALNEEEVMQEYLNGGAAVGIGSRATESDGTTKSRSASREYCVPGDTDTCDPPVAHWKFDEKGGTTAYDVSGNGNDGTLTNGPEWVVGKKNYALGFDGVDDFVDCGTDSSLKPSNEITVSTWIKLNSFPSGDPYFYQDFINMEYGYFLRTTGGAGGLEFGISSSTATSVLSQSISDALNKWTLISAVYNGSEQAIYVNGQKKNSRIFNNGINYSSPTFRIGGYNENRFFNGSIDDVRIYNYARTPAQIAWEYDKGKPVAEWKFDECQGSTIHDNSGNGLHGTLHLGSSGVTEVGTCASSSNSFWYNGRDGKRNSGGSFDNYSYVAVDDNSLLDLTTTMSVSAWVKPSQCEGDTFLSKYDFGNNNRSWRLYFEPNCIPRFIVSSDGTSGTISDISSVQALNLNNWNHFVVAYNGSTVKIYMDGVLTSSTSYSSDIFSGSADVSIGGNFDNGVAGNFFSGNIDEVKIYNYALTAEQVKTEYNQGAVRFGN